MDDQQIIELFFLRSEEAIKSVSSRYGKTCMSIATGILSNKEDAEECVNDAYLVLWNTIPPERPKSLAAYLCQIVRNISLMKYRYNTAEKRNTHYDVALDELVECLENTDSVQGVIEAKELSGAINRFLEMQKKMDRILFVKKYWFCMDTEELAEEMGLSRNYVNVHLHRTRQKLKLFLNKEGFYE